MKVYFVMAILASTFADTVYYQYFTDRNCQYLGEETAYVIDECFETRNDDNVLEYALAAWVTNDETVELSFHGSDTTCTNVSATGNWMYTLEVCVDHGVWGSELVSVNSYTEVFYQYFETDSCDDACDFQSTYVIGRCFETTNDDDDQWVRARATWVEEGSSVEIAFYDWSDNTCASSATEGPWQYTLDTCSFVEHDWSEAVSTTSMVCSTGGVSFWTVFIIIVSIIAVCSCVGWYSRKRRMRAHSDVMYNSQAGYQPPAQQQQVVYAQQQQQAPQYVQQQPQQVVYAQPQPPPAYAQQY